MDDYYSINRCIRDIYIDSILLIYNIVVLLISVYIVFNSIISFLLISQKLVNTCS